jgi:membrane fusion protein, multidrug efflux system
MKNNFPRGLKTITLLTLLGISTFLISCNEKKEMNKKEMAEMKIKHVRVSEAIVQDVPMYVDTFGYLTSEHDVNIVSQVTGQIVKLHFKEGDRVKKGDPIFSIYKAPFQALLNKAKAGLEETETNKNYEKYIVKKDKRLAETRAIAVQSFIKYVTQLSILESKINLFKAEIWQYQIEVNWCDITSPIDGVTGKRLVDVGNIVPANTGPVLVNIKSIDNLYIDFTIPEKNLYNLKKAFKRDELQVVIEVEEYDVNETNPDKRHIGRLQLFDNYVNNETGAIALRAIVENKNQKLWPGQYVRVKLILMIEKNKLLVPYRSVKQGLRGYYLYVIKDGKAVVHWVKRGLREGEWIVIENENNAIKPGDKIVTVGIYGLKPGDKVKILKKTDKFKTPTLPNYYFKNKKINKENELKQPKAGK